MRYPYKGFVFFALLNGLKGTISDPEGMIVSNTDSMLASCITDRSTKSNSQAHILNKGKNGAN